MRKNLIVLFLFLCVNILFSQTTDDYRSITSGNWNDTSSWERYNGTSWVAASSSPSSTNNIITISGTPTTSNNTPYTYTITLTGGCGTVNATGTIIVTPANTAGAASSSPTLCISTALTAITHVTTGATGCTASTRHSTVEPVEAGTTGGVVMSIV